MNAAVWSPGSIVSARGREWVVLSGGDGEVLRVRPVSGSEEDATRIHTGLEPVQDATFPRPHPEQRASHDATLLLRDALLLSLRRGAGPFRSFGQIAVEPRAYQLAPLLMALKQDPVRLLIADDVGIGKTIEAALIARELLDRGDVDRLAVLCPPHLVDQWVTELDERFHLRAVAVTATSASRLERDLPPSESVFTAFPFTVVSLDYIKSDRRRAEFLRACPELVIVDEAHACAATGAGRHQRYELLRGLSEGGARHLLLLTATPHSGDDAAFYRLLGLLDPAFQRIPEVSEVERNRLRERLAAHMVQRRRPDIDAWKDLGEGALFPRRETRELTYTLSGDWERFLAQVLDYCAAVVAREEADTARQRLSFWGTLALLRCAASSPAAAVLALRTRAGLETDPADRDALLDRLFDGGADGLPEDDVEPPVGVDDPALAALIERAERLAGASGDPKLRMLSEQLDRLLKDGFNPVVFCRYIATAHYLGRHLANRWRETQVGVVTGDMNPDERRAAVARLGEASRRVLIATDCLSEGINLQEDFDAVVHYDLSWNPTRHEQREGRVDRFGQPSPVVRATLMYGANNPVDGVVLEVILKKAERIKKELGVPVPLPDEGHTLHQALLKALLLRRGELSQRQGVFAFVAALDEARALDSAWQDAADKARKTSTVFAQRRLRPEEVLPEWRRTLAALGGPDAVARFVERALTRLGSGLEHGRSGARAPLSALPEELRERLEAEGLTGAPRLDFRYPPAPGARYVHRSHPLVSALAESLLERTLSASPDDADTLALGRVGCWISGAVDQLTVVVLLRMRHQLTRTAGRRARVLLVEEAAALAWSGADATLVAEGDPALALLGAPPLGDPPPPVRARVVSGALAALDRHAETLAAFAHRRAQALLADHERVRESSRARGGRHEVVALVPPDVVALAVLLPRVS